MNVLGFEIATNPGQTNEALDSLSDRLHNLREQTEDLYEGPAREMKLRREVTSMIKELSIGADPLNTFISTMDRLSESFRFALPVAIGVAAIIAIVDQEEKAKEKAVEWMDAIRDGALKARDGTVEGAKEGVKALEEAEKKYESMGWLERIIMGSARRGMKAILDRELASAKETLEGHDIQDIDNKTGAMSKDDEVAHAAELASKKAEYDEKIQKLRNAGEEMAANHMMIEQTAALDQIQRVWETKQKEKEDRETKHQRELADLAEDEALASRSRLDELGQKLADIQARLKSENPDGAEGMADRREQLRLQKEYEAEKQRGEQADDARVKKQQDDRAKLNAELAKIGYDELTRAEKIAALQQEAARVQYQMRVTDKDDPDAQLKDKVRLAQLEKAMLDLKKEGGGTALLHFDADTALRGNTASGGIAGALASTNLAADRAEKQREEMIKALNHLVGKPSLGDMESF